MRKLIVASFILVCAAGVTLVSAQDKPADPTTKPATKVDAKAALAELGKALSGTWLNEPNKGEEDKPREKIEFRFTSGGKVLMETMFPGTDHEMVNIYHLDKGELLVTHYCAMGNQPRMKLVSAANGEYTFEFKDGTNIPEKNPQYMGGLKISLANGAASETWTFFSNGKAGESMEMKLSRN